MSENKLSFEKAFTRLEEILDKMNEGSISLEKSLEMFEEANLLIKQCDSYLQNSERKIEKLIKDRSGKLALDENNQPQKEPLEISNPTL